MIAYLFLSPNFIFWFIIISFEILIMGISEFFIGLKIKKYFLSKKDTSPIYFDFFEKIKKSNSVLVMICAFLISFGLLLIVIGYSINLFKIIGSLMVINGFYLLLTIIIIVLIFKAEFESVRYDKEGLKSIESRDISKGMNEFKRALSLFPENYKAWSHLGDVYSRFTDFEKAIQSTRKALEINSNYREAWTILGSIYFDKGDFNQSCISYKRSLEINSKDSYIWHNLAKALLALGKEKEAQEAFNRSKELNTETNDNYVY